MKIIERIKIPLIICVLWAGLMYFFNYQEQVKYDNCAITVVMVNGETFNCAYATSYDNGTTRISLCDHKTIKVPTIHIKQIKYN